MGDDDRGLFGADGAPPVPGGGGLPGTDPVFLVFEAWRERQRRPGACTMTPARRDLIRRRLAAVDNDCDGVVTLIRYAYEARVREAEFWRASPQYLGLEYLLRRDKLPGRVERAREWADGESPEDASPGTMDEDIDLGPMRYLTERPKPAPVKAGMLRR